MGKINCNCCLCQAKATMDLTDKENACYYLCDSCGRFEISNAAKRKLETSLDERIKDFQNKIKLAPDGQVLSITIRNADNNLQGDYVDIKKVR